MSRAYGRRTGRLGLRLVRQSHRDNLNWQALATASFFVRCFRPSDGSKAQYLQL
jgi:hypothetical protein